MRIVFLGPPGAGKGTQAVRLSKALNVLHLSTGDMLRTAADAGTELGIKAKEYMKKGELVPDELVIGLLINEIKKNPEKGFILDGFPRTVIQAQALDKELNVLHLNLEKVFYFKTSENLVIFRLSGRRICQNCNTIFHIVNMPPKTENICDKCGKILVQRQDDTEKVIKNRLKIYQEMTAPVVDYYKRTNRLMELSGDLQVGELYEIILKLLESKK